MRPPPPENNGPSSASPSDACAHPSQSCSSNGQNTGEPGQTRKQRIQTLTSSILGPPAPTTHNHDQPPIPDHATFQQAPQDPRVQPKQASAQQQHAQGAVSAPIVQKNDFKPQQTTQVSRDPKQGQSPDHQHENPFKTTRSDQESHITTSKTGQKAGTATMESKSGTNQLNELHPNSNTNESCCAS